MSHQDSSTASSAEESSSSEEGSSGQSTSAQWQYRQERPAQGTYRRRRPAQGDGRPTRPAVSANYRRRRAIPPWLRRRSRGNVNMIPRRGERTNGINTAYTGSGDSETVGIFPPPISWLLRANRPTSTDRRDQSPAPQPESGAANSRHRQNSPIPVSRRRPALMRTLSAHSVISPPRVTGRSHSAGPAFPSTNLEQLAPAHPEEWEDYDTDSD